MALNEPEFLLRHRCGKLTMKSWESTMVGLKRQLSIDVQKESRHFAEALISSGDIGVSADAICTIRDYTRENPNYYDPLNKSLYAFDPELPSNTSDTWDDFAGNLLLACASVRENLDQHPPSQLYRVGWMPEQVWRDYFESKTGEEVFFCRFPECINFTTVSIHGVWD